MKLPHKCHIYVKEMSSDNYYKIIGVLSACGFTMTNAADDEWIDNFTIYGNNYYIWPRTTTPTDSYELVLKSEWFTMTKNELATLIHLGWEPFTNMVVNDVA